MCSSCCVIEIVLAVQSFDIHTPHSHIPFSGGSFAEFQHDDSSIELDCAENQRFSIWISFAEIYNEFIYDLLSEPPAKGKLRTALKISEDKNHNHFIKGRFV